MHYARGMNPADVARNREQRLAKEQAALIAKAAKRGIRITIKEKKK